MIFGLKKSNKYLYGCPFTIVTDAQSIKEMFHPDKDTPAVASARIQRWSVYLSHFEYNILHRSSTKMAVLDALSRLPLKDETEEDCEIDEFNVSAIFEELPVTFDEIVTEARMDKEYEEWKTAVQNGFPVKCHGDMLTVKRAVTLLTIDEEVIFMAIAL